MRNDSTKTSAQTDQTHKRRRKSLPRVIVVRCVIGCKTPKYRSMLMAVTTDNESTLVILNNLALTSIIQHCGAFIRSYIKDIVSVGWHIIPVPVSTKERTMTRNNSTFFLNRGVRQNVRTVKKFRPTVIDVMATLRTQAAK